VLSQTVGYAIQALGYLAGRDGQPILVREIAGDTGIPAGYLAKIVNTLARKGYVSTQRGIGGGVTLNRAAEGISLFELASAFDDPLVQVKCMLGTAACSDDRACPCHSFWKPHRDRIIEFLRSTSVMQVAEFEARAQSRRVQGGR
jgi:Rrf2 family iron-sulfur cluster assembly transcriptional regulator